MSQNYAGQPVVPLSVDAVWVLPTVNAHRVVICAFWVIGRRRKLDADVSRSSSRIGFIRQQGRRDHICRGVRQKRDLNGSDTAPDGRTSSGVSDAPILVAGVNCLPGKRKHLRRVLDRVDAGRPPLDTLEVGVPEMERRVVRGVDHQAGVDKVIGTGNIHGRQHLL